MKLVHDPNMPVKHRATLQALGDFCGADEVRYVDHGKGETYTIVKDGKVLTLKVRADGKMVCVYCAIDEEQQKELSELTNPNS